MGSAGGGADAGGVPQRRDAHGASNIICLGAVAGGLRSIFELAKQIDNVLNFVIAHSADALEAHLVFEVGPVEGAAKHTRSCW